MTFPIARAVPVLLLALTLLAPAAAAEPVDLTSSARAGHETCAEATVDSWEQPDGTNVVQVGGEVTPRGCSPAFSTTLPVVGDDAIGYTVGQNTGPIQFCLTLLVVGVPHADATDGCAGAPEPTPPT